jgi:hypothetical protein
LTHTLRKVGQPSLIVIFLIFWAVQAAWAQDNRPGSLRAILSYAAADLSWMAEVEEVTLGADAVTYLLREPTGMIAITDYATEAAATAAFETDLTNETVFQGVRASGSPESGTLTWLSGRTVLSVASGTGEAMQLAETLMDAARTTDLVADIDAGVSSPPGEKSGQTGATEIDDTRQVDRDLLRVRSPGTLTSDTGWSVTADKQLNTDWMYPGYDASAWASAAADWSNRPAPPTSVAGMEDTAATWIWHPDDPDRAYFRREFILEYRPYETILRITADNDYIVYVNGYEVGRDEGAVASVWNTAERYDLTPYLSTGAVVVSVIGSDHGGGSGLLVDILFSGPETVPADPPRPPSVGSTSQFVGCYKDKPNRDLDGYYQSRPDMSISACVALCADGGFAYAGTQYGSQCFCGNSYGTHGPAGNCDMPCVGAADETCGGFWANSVYAVGETDTVAPPAPDNSEILAALLAQGKEFLSQAHWAEDAATRDTLFDKAMGLFEEARELGSAEAVYHIGFMYEIGSGVPQDNDIALAYYDVAAHGGYAEGYAQAILVLNQLGRHDAAALIFFDYANDFPDLAMQGFDDFAYSPQVSKEIQKELKRTGYYSGAIDGIIGPGTRGAISQYVATEIPGEMIQPNPIDTGGQDGQDASSGQKDQGNGGSDAMELAFWTSIESSADPADFDAYLQQWPNGTFAALARNRLNRLSSTGAGQTGGRTGDIYTPARGTPERAAIMDAARVPIGADLGQRVIFVVDELRSDGEWVFLQAVPKQPDGKPIKWLTTPFAASWRQDMMTDVVMVLLRSRNGQMQVVDYVIGPTDVYWYTWVEAHGLPETFFFPG